MALSHKGQTYPNVESQTFKKAKGKFLYSTVSSPQDRSKHPLSFSGKHPAMLQLMCEGCSYTYPPLSIARYSFIQLSELEQCRVKQTCPRFNTIAQDPNPGSLSRECVGLPLSHCLPCLDIELQVLVLVLCEGTM